MKAKLLGIAALLQVSALVAAQASPPLPCPVDRLTPLTGNAGDDFGASVAISPDGTNVVVGSPYADGAFSDLGAAFLFRKMGHQWVQVHRFEPATLASLNFHAGYAVAVSNSARVVLGRFGNSNSAYVFEDSGGVWLEAPLQPLVPVTGSNFGQSVAIDEPGQWLFVGAPTYRAPGTTTFTGAVYVFQRVGANWVERAILTSPGVAGRFGTSIACSGGRLVVGARDLASSGKAYVHELQAGVWVQVAQFAPVTATGSDYYGASAAISGDIALVGAPRDDDTGNDRGAVYVYARSNGVWSQVQKLKEVASQGLGESVAVSGDTILAGAPNQSIGTSVAQGTVRVYLRQPNGTWSLQVDQTAFDGASISRFGSGVALAGSTMVVGSRSDLNQHGTGGGSAYVYDVSGQACTALLGEPPVVSLQQGGTQQLFLSAGTAQAMRFYFMLGSMTGTTPGFNYQGFHVPLRPDRYLLMTLGSNCAPYCSGFSGLLGADGKALAAMQLPAGFTSSLAGVTLNHAFVVLNPTTFRLTFVSNPDPLALVP